MNKLSDAWNFTFEKMLHPGTNLIYDYRVDTKDGDPLTWHLPSVEYIQKSIPNPCGWGTGMEDCMITAGVALDCILAKYEVTRDVSLRSMAKRVFSGMNLCASVSDQRGFLARSVSPVDGVTHYMDSSRDQYTHFVYSSIAYFFSDLVSDTEKEQIKNILVSFADRAERNITEENDWNYLREDGQKGAVVRMWGPKVGKHEAFRLPMIYIAAWVVSGEEKYFELYMKYRDEALEISKSIDYEKKPPLPFGISQMVYSLRLAYDHDPDAEFKARTLEYLKWLADYCKPKAVSYVLEACSPQSRHQLDYSPVPWEEAPAFLEKYLDGYAYFVPTQLFTWKSGYPTARKYPVYSACYATVYLLCPGTPYDEELMRSIEMIIDTIDYDKHRTNGPIFPLGAYYAMMAKKE